MQPGCGNTYRNTDFEGNKHNRTDAKVRILVITRCAYHKLRSKTTVIVIILLTYFSHIFHCHPPFPSPNLPKLVLNFPLFALTNRLTHSSGTSPASSFPVFLK